MADVSFGESLSYLRLAACSSQENGCNILLLFDRMEIPMDRDGTTTEHTLDGLQNQI